MIVPFGIWIFLAIVFIGFAWVTFRTHRWYLEAACLLIAAFVGAVASVTLFPLDVQSDIRDRVGFRYDYAAKPDPARIKVEPKKLLAADPNAARWVIRIEVTPNAAKDGVPLPDLTSIYTGHVWYKDPSGTESYAVVFKEE